MPSNVNLFRKYNNNSIFIETGSCNGEGIRNALFAGFKDVYSIELEDTFYQYCKSYFKYTDNVHLFKGDSVEELPKILSTLNTSATFWLDAHYSGGETGFVNVLTPLMKELDIIGAHPIKTHTIIIDDLREWKRDYPAIGFGTEEIIKKLSEINSNYMFFYEDGFVGSDVLVADARAVKPINITVFSKDRAMQLELFIRSFNHFVVNNNLYVINVLYTHSDDRFKSGYDYLMNKGYPNVVFHKETDFKKNLLELVNPVNEHTIFFVDDIVFKNPFDFYDKQMEIFDWDASIICRSLRLHTDLNYCYPQQKAMKQPPFLNNNIFVWRGLKGDYGYPLSVDGNIYRTKDILPFAQELNYTNPNTFEGEMATRTHGLPPKMICYERSIVLSNPLNRVQTVNQNTCGTITAEFLNNKFLGGFIIDLKDFEGLHNRSCHQEVPVNFIRE